MGTVKLAGPVLFLSTLSLRRATSASRILRFNPLISIHALLAESDSALLAIHTKSRISIHALLAESDPMISETV